MKNHVTGTDKSYHIVCIQYLFRLFITGILLFFSGCGGSAGRYTPEYNELIDSIVSIEVKHPVKIINAQPSSEEHVLEFREIIVDYHSFTQALVDALQARFARSANYMDDSDVKELNVKVVKVTMYSNGANYRANIYAEISFGDNPAEYFQTSRASYASPFMMHTYPKKPLDAAFKDLVYEILKNKNIRDYLNQ